MANPNKPSGLTPVKYLGGADWDGKANVYCVPSTDGNALFVGDPVKLAGSADANGIATVTLATAGAACLGAIVGIGVNPGGPFVDPDNLSLVSAPATKLKAYYVLVVDDPSVIYEIQEIGTGTVFTATEVGLNADFVAGVPATGVKVSAFMLNNVGEATTDTLNLKILGLARRVDNAFGQYAKYLVLINNHHFRAGVAGV